MARSAYARDSLFNKSPYGKVVVGAPVSYMQIEQGSIGLVLLFLLFTNMVLAT